MTDYGGAAFPFVYDDKDQRHIHGGMTLRDYFAAKAMHALLLAAKTSKDVDLTANAAYAMADAMLKERTK